MIGISCVDFDDLVDKFVEVVENKEPENLWDQS